MIFWILWIAAGTGFELWALYTHKTRLTLTHVLLTHIPRWIIAMALGWVVYHLLIERIYP